MKSLDEMSAEIRQKKKKQLDHATQVQGVIQALREWRGSVDLVFQEIDTRITSGEIDAARTQVGKVKIAYAKAVDMLIDQWESKKMSSLSMACVFDTLDPIIDKEDYPGLHL